MTLKIEKIFSEGKTRIRLSGQLRAKHLGQLRAEVGNCRPEVMLDLEEVELADLGGIRFLNKCESAGVSIVHCSSFIREWMLQERCRPKK